jgi:hypothetical protein
MYTVTLDAAGHSVSRKLISTTRWNLPRHTSGRANRLAPWHLGQTRNGRGLAPAAAHSDCIRAVIGDLESPSNAPVQTGTRSEPPRAVQSYPITPANATSVAPQRASNKAQSGVAVVVTFLVVHSAAGWAEVTTAVSAVHWSA